jgi:1-acyl-sn-glycerol-3-phosphate acyltransferase
LPFKKGGFVMANRGGAKIVPMTILGTRQAMRKGSPIIRPVTVTVRIGAPIDPAAFGRDQRDALVGATRAAMEALLEVGPITEPM